MASATWTKLEPLPGHANLCLMCDPIPQRLSLDAMIAVGFGDAHASRDGEIVYREPSAYDPHQSDCERCGGTGRVGEMGTLSLSEFDKLPHCESCAGNGFIRAADAPEPEPYWDVAEVEALAAIDPDHDWRIVLFAPLHGEVFQRHGEGEWNLVEKNQGFA